MLPSEYKRMKKAELEAHKTKVHKRISNTFIESAIRNATVEALKTIYYLAAKIENMADFVPGSEKGLLRMEIDTRDMLKYTKLELISIRKHLTKMQETSITFQNEVEGWEEGIALLPYYKFVYGKHKIQVEIYQKIANLIVDVKKNYSMIDTNALMQLKSKYALRILALLMRISQYSDGTPKRKRMELDDFNEFFGTKYKRLIDIENRILIPAQKELDLYSKLTFTYETNYDVFGGRGRPKAYEIIIDVVDNSGSLFAVGNQQKNKLTILKEQTKNKTNKFEKYIGKKISINGKECILEDITDNENGNYFVTYRDQIQTPLGFQIAEVDLLKWLLDVLIP